MTTAVTALFCSSVFQKTATSLISTYLIIVVMFMAPLGVKFFAQTFYQGSSQARGWRSKVGVLSPFSAVFALPLNVEDETRPASNATPATFGFDDLLRVYWVDDCVQLGACARDDTVVSSAVAGGGLEGVGGVSVGTARLCCASRLNAGG